MLRGAYIVDNFITPEAMPSFCRQHLSKGNLPLWEQKIFSFILNFLDSSDSIIQQSSGTTGIPKKIKIPKETMIRSALLTAGKFDLQQGQSALLCLPVDYIAGKMMIVRALVTGMKLLWIEPSVLPEGAVDKKVDFCAMVPLQVFSLLEKGYPFSHIKNLIIGGSALSAELEKRLQALPCRIFETFGMTETCSHIALRRINGPYARSWFRALPGVKISADESHCLIIQAPFLPDPVVTHDVVEITGKNTFRWKGRYDNVINSGGIKINPEELEKKIFAVLGHELYLVGLPDDKLGQKMVMVTMQHYSPAEKAAALKKMRKKLPVYHVPAEIITMDSFSRNRSFKIDRKVLTGKIMKMKKKLLNL